MSADADKRDSRALEPEVITDPLAKAEAEARNGFRQYDLGVRAIQAALERGSFKLRPSLVLALHREALAGISIFAGNFRPAGVQIQGSRHEPAGAHLVPELIEEMCDYVNEHWEATTPIHLGAYIMWRLNWIHPFADGNGRTSRILSYVVLSIRAGALLPERPRSPIKSATTGRDISRHWTRPTMDGKPVGWMSAKWRSYSAACWQGSSLISTKPSEERSPRNRAALSTQPEALRCRPGVHLAACALYCLARVTS
jgi:hypothetical protein